MNLQRFSLVLACFFSCLAGIAQSASVDLKLGLIRAGGQDYFVELLKQSLEAQGHTVNLEVLGDLPQKRMLIMMQQGDLTLTWLVQSKQRDIQYQPVEVGITGGLIGHRILLIPKGEQSAYQGVENLDDFRALNKVGVFGEGWFDSKVWELNDLPFIEKTGNWQSSVYDQIAAGNRGIDYFSRGFFEVVEEAEAHPRLAIEQELMLVYDRDFRFYLSAKSASLKPILKQALMAAKQSGLMKRLIEKHWASAFARLQPDQRRKIMLATPSGE